MMKANGFFVSKAAALLMAVAVLMAPAVTVFAEESADVKESTAAYLADEYEGMGLGAEWAVIAIARGELAGHDDFILSYLDSLKNELDECGGELGENYSEYSRVVLALTALGLDPTDFGGYNLLAPLADLETVTGQAINGAAYALLALDGGGYEMPDGSAFETASTRELLVEFILENELETGGFMDPWGGVVDITAIALMALRPYAGDEEVAAVIERGAKALAANQLESGAFGEVWGESGDSTAQAIIALCNLGYRLSELEYDAVAGLMNYYDAEQGAFFYQYTDFESSELITVVNAMTSEQALRALIACERLEGGLSAMNDMTDITGTVKALNAAIAALPAELTLADSEAVAEVRALYDSLGYYQRLVFTDAGIITEAEAKIARLSAGTGTTAAEETAAGIEPTDAASPNTGSASAAPMAGAILMSAATAVYLFKIRRKA